jgi:predicted Zn-dependent peptidase
VLSLAGGAALPATGQEPGKIPYETFQLPNGLSVILSEDHSTQVVSVNLWFDVGSRNERPSRTGFAHLFEHMMFQGSAHVKKAEHSQLVERAGGHANGQTEDDITRYYETVPSNRVNLALWLEADRMRSLAVTPENFQNQRETVKEERRQRIDNQPYAGPFLDGLYGLYDSTDCFPYSHSTIGSMADLDSATIGDVQAFFQLYYAPNNARLVIAGDFNSADIRQLVESYFGDIPRADAPPAVACTAGFNAGARRNAVTDKLANLPATVKFYRIPRHDHGDTPALELLGTILGQGESSRLNMSLARTAQAAVATQAGIFGDRRGPSAFGAFAVANQGVSADSLDALLTAELTRLATDGVSEAELTKAKNVYRAGLISGRQRSFEVSEALQHAATFHGDLATVNTDLARYLSVTLEDIKRVAEAYLRPENCFTLIVNAGASS